MPKEPSKATLKKYGLTLEEWKAISISQGQVCYICGKLPESGVLCVDHYHQKGFKKMKPEDKKKYIRGLLCTYCNFRMLPRGMTAEKATKIAEYLSKPPIFG